jgi:hypothetical protein
MLPTSTLQQLCKQSIQTGLIGQHQQNVHWNEQLIAFVLDDREAIAIRKRRSQIWLQTFDLATYWRSLINITDSDLQVPQL